MRFLWTALAYLLALCIVAPVAFLVVIFLAGPHAGLLPELIEAVVLVIGWAAMLLLPIGAAWKVWQRSSVR